MGVSIVVPICGMRRCVEHYTRDLAGRSLPLRRFRIVFMGSKAGSGSVRILGSGVSFDGCAGFRVCGGRGNNLDSTEGFNLSGVANSCI